MSIEQPHRQQQLTMRSRGLNANDPFNNKDSIKQYTQNIAADALRQERFQCTDRGIYFRKIEEQNNIVGVEVLNVNHRQLQSVRTGANFLSEALRTIALETRDIISDLIKLQKMIKTKQFEDIPAILTQ